MDITKLKRNPDKIKSMLKVGKNVTTTGNLRIIFPTRYLSRDLCQVGKEVNTLAVVALLDDDDNYAVIRSCVFIKFTPSDMSDIVIGGKDYIQLTFEPGSVVTESLNLLKRAGHVSDIIVEFLFNGNVPWYIGMDELNQMLAEAYSVTGSGLANNKDAIETIISVISRNPLKPTESYRDYLASGGKTLKPIYISLTNVPLGVKSTISKITGSYLNLGILSSLVVKEDTPIKLDKILRG